MVKSGSLLFIDVRLKSIFTLSSNLGPVFINLALSSQFLPLKFCMHLSSLLCLATCRRKNNCNLKKKNDPEHHYNNNRKNVMYTPATIQTAHTSRVESNLSCKTPPLSLPRPTPRDVIQWGHRIKTTKGKGKYRSRDTYHAHVSFVSLPQMERRVTPLTSV